MEKWKPVDWNDHRGQMEQWRAAAEVSLEHAPKADAEGDTERGERLRRRAAWQMRNVELHERLDDSGLFGELFARGSLYFQSLDVETAHGLLDRFEAVGVDDVFRNPEASEHAEGRLDIIREQAMAWAFANEVRQAALKEVVRMVMVMRGDGVDVNLTALARLTGISRQTLHAHLRDPGAEPA
jgi:hypothetical protein